MRTPFGWHLIQVRERRKQDVTHGAPARSGAPGAARSARADEQFQEFVRQMRDRAYVEYKVDER